MIRPSSSAKNNLFKKRTEAFAMFLVRRQEYEAKRKEIAQELEKSNEAMSRMTKKFKWRGSLP
jgi:hypothetical protein